MSISDQRQTDFDHWIADQFARTGSFTALIVLVSIDGTQIQPLCSTYFNVIGDEVLWAEVVVLFAGSGMEWDGAAFFPTAGREGGPIDNPTARVRLRELEAAIAQNRLILNDGHLFDKWGRRLEVEEVTLQ